jgi:hypothetical protein
MNFFTTFARIAGYAAKSVFAAIYEMPNETATLDDIIIKGGIKRSAAWEGLAELQACGFIIKIKAGLYRVCESAPPESSSPRNGGGGGGSKETHARTQARG